MRLSRDAHGMHLACARLVVQLVDGDVVDLLRVGEHQLHQQARVVEEALLDDASVLLAAAGAAAAAQAQQLGFALGRLLLSAHRPQLALRIGEGRAQLLRLARERLVLLSELRAAHLELELERLQLLGQHEQLVVLGAHLALDHRELLA